MDISNQIKTRREAMGLSQEQLAEKLYVSRQTISNWERDKTYPDVQSLLMLSILFGTSIDTLVKGDVTVMEEAVERDRKRMGTRMLWLAVLMLALLAVAFALILSPAFNWMEGTWGAASAAACGVPAGDSGASLSQPSSSAVKRENDLVTYREILAFMNGEANIERDPRALPPPRVADEASTGVRLADFHRRGRHRRSTRLCRVGVAELEAASAEVRITRVKNQRFWAAACARDADSKVPAAEDFKLTASTSKIPATQRSLPRPS